MAEKEKLELSIPVDILSVLESKLQNDDNDAYEELKDILFAKQIEVGLIKEQGEKIDEVIVKLPDNERGRNMLLILRNAIVVLMSKFGNLEKRILSLLG